MDTNYSQIVQQSIEDKISMYMKLPKKKLAEMLANRDLLDRKTYSDVFHTTAYFLPFLE